MIIRDAVQDDTERIAITHRASIEVLCSGYYDIRDISGWVDILSPGIYENAINEKVMLVAEEGSDILGMGIMDFERREINALYVHPKIQGMGVGKLLLMELEAKASESNLDQLILYSTINALEFYIHFGYREGNKTFHDLPNGIRLECIRMHKMLR